ncbi:MAG: DHA2 family efflux MFS transporter permease subunit [Chlamydiota bacterium]
MNNKLLFFVFFLTLGLVTVNNTLPLMAAPYIVGELGASNDISFYVVTFYSIGNALGVPLGRGAMGRLQPCVFFLIILSLLAAVSFLTTMATSYSSFIALRLLKGILGGTVFPVISTLLSAIASEKQKTRITYTIVTIFTVVPAIGAACGGWISYDYHWQWLFQTNVPLCLICGVYLYQRLRGCTVVLEKVPFDTVGYVFYVVSILAISISLTMGQQLDWFRSPVITALSVLGVITGGFFVLWECNHPYPILDFRLLKNFAFTFALFNLGVLFSAYFGMVILLAFWLTLWVNYTPIWIGLIMGTMAIAGILPRLLFVEGYEKMDTRYPIIISTLLLALSSFHTMFFSVDIDLGRIAFSRVIAGFGLAFFLSPLFRICFHTFPQEKTLPVVGFFQLVRVLSGGLGAAFYSILFQRRQVFFHERLGEKLNVFSSNTKEYFNNAALLNIEGRSAVAELGNLLDRQATALALDDCFYLMVWILIGLFVLTLFTFFYSSRPFFPEKFQKELQ